MTNAILENMDSMTGVTMGGQEMATGFDVQNIQVMLESMYIDSSIVEYVVALVDNIYDVVSHSGVQILLFLAGLQSISPSIYESAQMEGATGWEIFWKITAPMISPIIFVNAIYSVVDMFTRADNNIMLLIDDMAFNKMNYSVSSAMAWLYFVALAVLLGLVALICYRFVFYQERD
jgi:ABC-type sugar transport system permease subunit